MAKAIFLRAFNYTSRKRNVGWHVEPMAEPQYFPQELIDAALAKQGVAIPAPDRKPRKKGAGGVAGSALESSSLGQALNPPAVAGDQQELSQ